MNIEDERRYGQNDQMKDEQPSTTNHGNEMDLSPTKGPGTDTFVRDGEQLTIAKR